MITCDGAGHGRQGELLDSILQHHVSAPAHHRHRTEHAIHAIDGTWNIVQGQTSGVWYREGIRVWTMCTMVMGAHVSSCKGASCYMEHLIRTNEQRESSVIMEQGKRSDVGHLVTSYHGVRRSCGNMVPRYKDKTASVILEHRVMICGKRIDFGHHAPQLRRQRFSTFYLRIENSDVRYRLREL